MKTLALICLLSMLALSGTAMAVAVDERPLDDPAKEAEARDIMKGIRCLVCQNQSIEDSNADLARDLRRVVRERVAAGDDADAVQAYLVARYGDWVLLRPPFKSRTLVLWIAPLLFLVTGAGALAVTAARRKREAGRGSVNEALSSDEEATIGRLRKDLGA